MNTNDDLLVWKWMMSISDICTDRIHNPLLSSINGYSPVNEQWYVINEFSQQLVNIIDELRSNGVEPKVIPEPPKKNKSGWFKVTPTYISNYQ